jgi:translocation and assembly module TamB
MSPPVAAHETPKVAGPKVPGRARRAIFAVAKALGVGVVVALAAVGGVVLHVGMPAPRRFAVARVNGILEGTFKGKITIERVGLLHLTRIDGVDAKVFDPEGHMVLDIRGLRARFGTLTLVRSLVSGKSMIINIPELSINGLEAVLEENAAGELGVVRAFDSATPDTGKPSSGTDVTIGAIQIPHVWVHGHMAAVPVLDADLKDFAGGFISTPKSTGIDVQHLLVRGRGIPGMNPEGLVVARATLPADPKGETRVTANYDGRIGDIPVRADGSLTGKTVVAVVDVPETAPAAFEALKPGQIHLGAPLSAHAEVHGELPVLKPELRAHLGAGEITAAGTVTLPEGDRVDLSATAQVNVKDLDVSLAETSAPPSRLTAMIEASIVSRPGGKITGTYHVENQVGEVSGQVVPAASVRGELTEKSVRGVADIAEIGAPTNVQFSLAPRAGSSTPNQLDFKARATVPDLNAITRIGPVARGRASVSVEGGLDLETKSLSAHADGDVGGINQSGVQLASAKLSASVNGSLDAPRFKADVRGGGLRAGGYAFTSVNASATGTPSEIDVTTRLVGAGKAPTVTGRAHVSTAKDLMVSNAAVTLDRDVVTTTATIAAIRVAGGTVDVRGAKIEGLGDPILASARIAPASMSVKAKSTDVDLERVAELLGREEDVHGHLALDVDAVATRRGIDGRVGAELRDLSAQGIKDGSVRVALTGKGTHLQGEITAALGAVGKLVINASDVNLGGPPMEPASWKKATGAVAITGALDLQKLLAEVPEESRPIFAASGAVAIRGQASRPSLTEPPALELEASTSGLTLIGNQDKKKNADGSVTLGPAPWRTEGTDGTFGIKLEGSTGRTEIKAKLHDKLGPLVSLEAGATLPITALAESPDKAAELTRDTPLDARIIVPLRSIEALPPALGPLPLRGEIELDAVIKGTMRAPKLTLDAKGTNLRSRTAAACVPVVAATAHVGYESGKAGVRVAVLREQREVMVTDADVKVNLAEVLAGSALAWEASANMALTQFPLDTVSAFLEQPIGGDVSGKVAVKDLHRAASLDAALDLHGLSLDRAVFPSGKVTATVKDGALAATARLDQKDGYAEVGTKGAIKWGAEVAPAIDLAQPIDVDIRAKNFRANAAMPFLQGTVTELDGRVDADAKLHVQPGGKDGTMSGAIALREGIFEVPQIGERFHNLQGKVVMKPLGTIRLEDFSAEGTTGKVTATAEAVIKGVALQSATAKVDIGKSQALPLVFDGLSIGKAYGSITTKAQMAADGKRLDVSVNIPSFHLELPQSTGNSVQPLEPEKTVRIGLHSKRDFVTIPLAPPQETRAASDMVIRAAVKLGNDIEIKRDTTIDVVVGGETLIEVGQETRVTGQIRLARGKLEIQGKQFMIDRGIVTFVGPDPADPQVIATAYWDAPDNIRVYADFSGRVTSGKLTLRSEPALTQDEILALILFGSPDGSFGAAPKPGQQESTGAQAAGIAGGVVTQGLNKAISGLTSADITTRVDTSEADNPRPELAVQLSKKVSARIGYKLGVPAPGDNPDRTELTIDWRFVRNWSLSAVVGDQGSTALDVVWRLRY